MQTCPAGRHPESAGRLPVRTVARLRRSVHLYLMNLDVAPSELEEAWPPLRLDEWRDTRDTLQLYSQVVGKLKLKLSPPLNHWWHVALYVTPRGLSTGPI